MGQQQSTMGQQQECNRRRLREALRQGIRNGSVRFADLPEVLRDDAEIALTAVQEGCWRVRDTSTRLWSKKDFVLGAVKVCAWNLLYASEELQGNREIVLEAIRQDGSALRFASEELQGNREIVLEAIRQDCSALEHASEELRADREIVLEAIRQDGCALEYASEELRADREIVLEAVRQHAWALEYASAELRADREIVLEAVRQDGQVLRYASEELRENREIVLSAIENAVDELYVLPYVPNNLVNDPMVAAARLIKGDLEQGSEIMERLESVLLAVRALPENFTRCVVDEASVLEFCRRWELSIWHKIWMALQLEPPGMEGTGQVIVKLSGLPLELRQARELLHCAPVIGAALSLDCDWRDLDSYPVYELC